MDLDLRVPVGLLFVILGLIMGIFGLTSNPALYEKSLGINVNLYWGIAELIFGSLMIAFGQSAHVDTPPHDGVGAPPPATRTISSVRGETSPVHHV